MNSIYLIYEGGEEVKELYDKIHGDRGVVLSIIEDYDSELEVFIGTNEEMGDNVRDMAELMLDGIGTVRYATIIEITSGGGLVTRLYTFTKKTVVSLDIEHK